MFDAQVSLERLLKPADVFVTAFAPAVGGGVRGVANLQFGDGGLGVRDARFHWMLSAGTAVTNLTDFSARLANCVRISVARFQGNTSTWSGGS